MKRVQSFPSHMLPVGRFHKFGRFKHHNCWSSAIFVQNLSSHTCPLSNLVIINSLDSEFIGFPCIVCDLLYVNICFLLSQYLQCYLRLLFFLQ